jgi:formylglycine-generating enzyme required for sulfatase activity
VPTGTRGYRSPATLRSASASPVAEVPPLDACVVLPAGTYRVGEPGEERAVALPALLIGRYPVANAHLRRFVAETGHAAAPDLAARLAQPLLAGHPATGLTFAEARAFCAWAAARLDRPVRLPTGDEWEAAARGADGRPWPWGDVFDAERCACAESGWGSTVPVTTHPAGAGPCGAEQLAGNVWEWVDADGGDGWVQVRGGSYLDHAWGLRASRALPADPARATATTGLRIAIDLDQRTRGGDP